MSDKKEPSSYNSIIGKFTFTNEPLWFRLLVILMTAAILFGLIYALQKWAIPTGILNKLTGIKWLELLKSGKGRSP